ncbi:hypothetical protein Acife_1488 [Acidithiobacillus ferrivorans SS3]|jgi:hypothetical protein|uniref:Uncharacterized protein n=1 Tax=Acidithiobacillus ferrivorans SS3 TaxID=743299 RepID=G0JRP0_9PROT|nr:hypothetical protein Acife_1488 [Acidithiobacillus ferrivorans SS3]
MDTQKLLLTAQEIDQIWENIGYTSHPWMGL